MGVKLGALLCLLFSIVGTGIRTYQMLTSIDPVTGFYTDTSLSLLFTIMCVLVVVFFVLAFRIRVLNKRHFEFANTSILLPAFGRAVFSIISAVAFFLHIAVFVLSGSFFCEFALVCSIVLYSWMFWRFVFSVAGVQRIL